MSDDIEFTLDETSMPPSLDELFEKAEIALAQKTPENSFVSRYARSLALLAKQIAFFTGGVVEDSEWHEMVKKGSVRELLMQAEDIAKRLHTRCREVVSGSDVSHYLKDTADHLQTILELKTQALSLTSDFD